jgi:hypothetical protein
MNATLHLGSRFEKAFLAENMLVEMVHSTHSYTEIYSSLTE